MEALTLFGTLEEFHAALGEGIRVLSYNLTQDEARVSVAQTLGVVHGLVGNVKLIMEGAQCLNDCSQVVF